MFSLKAARAASLVAAFGPLLSHQALADAGHQPIPDGHAPAGVMVDHLHKAGEFMVGYRYSWGRQSGDITSGGRPGLWPCRGHAVQ